MKRSESPVAALLLAALLPAGCGFLDQEPPACRAGMPVPASLRADPAFAALKYHRRIDFDVTRGVGYDVWGDAKYEYATALQFSLRPVPGGRGDALRLTMPPNPDQQAMVAAFLRDMGRAQGVVDAAPARVEAMIARRDKYRDISRTQEVSFGAGVVVHPTRGEFFVVGFDWNGR